MNPFGYSGDRRDFGSRVLEDRKPFVEENPPLRGLHQAPWHIRAIAANGGLDAKGAVFPGQQHLRRADSHQQAAVGCKKDVPPVPNGVRKGRGMTCQPWV